MRIISQNGELDFPYELIVVWRNENIVYASPAADSKTGLVLGEYETPQKAEEAMSELKYAFLCNEKNKTGWIWEYRYSRRIYGITAWCVSISTG